MKKLDIFFKIAYLAFLKELIMDKTRVDVDLVYLWVDGSDPIWRKKKEEISGISSATGETDNEGRYKNNDELRYSLRSVEKFVPWVRKIFIVTDNQIPRWLQLSNSKIQIIDHREILPEKALPCFNAYLIECFLYKIPGLSEHFLYANDDMFFNTPLTFDFFFGKGSFPIVRMKKDPMKSWFKIIRIIVGKNPGNYQRVIDSAKSFIKSRYGISYPGEPHHNVDAYKKSDFREAVEDVFCEKIKKSLGHHVRSDDDVTRFGFSLYTLAMKRAWPEYVTKETSLRNQLYKRDFRERMEKYRPKLFCMNDNQKTTDADRNDARLFLEEHFPDKSPFEK